MSAAARRKQPNSDAVLPGRGEPHVSLIASTGPSPDEAHQMVERARRVASEIAARHAEDVDAQARFPHEAFEALRRENLLGIMIPRALGGQEANVATLAEICNLLAQSCASTGMIYAMHQIKVSSLVVHCTGDAWHRDFMTRIATEQLLLGSATTEGGGIGGDMRNSICGVVRDGEDFELTKNGCLISYGSQADAILITARSHIEAPASDQVMAVMTKAQYSLERSGVWNTMGMRGTCSHNFAFAGRAPAEQIIATPFAEIAAHSMLPYAHLLWASVWCGIASDAVDRAERFVRAEARKKPGTTPAGAVRLAELLGLLQRLKSLIVTGIERYERVKHDPDELSAIGFVVAMNSIKIVASQSVNEIVNLALLVCGIQGYRNDSPFSLSRHIRDALSSPIMINNDRILGNTSQLLAAHKHDSSLFR